MTKTRAQEFREQELQANRVKRPARPKAKKAEPDAGAVDARSHAGRRGGAALEDSATKPSRKSTRKSSNRTKRTTNLQLRAEREARSPQVRHLRNQVKR